MTSAEYQREWDLKNPGRRKANHRRWYLKNKEKEQAKSRERYKYDKERASQYYYANKEKIQKYAKEYRKTDTCKASKRCSHHKRKAEGSFTVEDIKDLYATQGGRCYYCSMKIEKGYHIDHMTPLSRGGKNDVSNICLACAPCNLSKHTKTAEEFQGAG